MDVWYNTAKTMVGAYLALFVHKIHVVGRENIPAGPKIIVANHALASDAFILPWIFRDKVHCLIQADIFSVPLIGKMLALADQIPVVAGKGMEALEIAKEKLDQGDVVALFPEGRLNDGKGMLRAYSGATRLSLQSEAPLISVGFYTPPKFAHAIRSSVHGRQTYGSWQFGGPCFISIGETWQPRLESSMNSLFAYNRMVRGLTDDMMVRITALVEQARTFSNNFFYPQKSEQDRLDGPGNA